MVSVFDELKQCYGEGLLFSTTSKTDDVLQYLRVLGGVGKIKTIGEIFIQNSTIRGVYTFAVQQQVGGREILLQKVVRFLLGPLVLTELLEVLVGFVLSAAFQNLVNFVSRFVASVASVQLEQRVHILVSKKQSDRSKFAQTKREIRLIHLFPGRNSAVYQADTLTEIHQTTEVIFF